MFFTYRSIFQKTFEREMLVQSKRSTLLQIFCELLLYTQVVSKSMRLADDTFQSTSECEWVNVAYGVNMELFSKEKIFSLWSWISISSRHDLKLLKATMCWLHMLLMVYVKLITNVRFGILSKSRPHVVVTYDDHLAFYCIKIVTTRL